MPKPVLQSLILADHVYEDKLTGKRIIAGVFNRIIRGVRVVKQVGPPAPSTSTPTFQMPAAPAQPSPAEQAARRELEQFNEPPQMIHPGQPIQSPPAVPNFAPPPAAMPAVEPPAYQPPPTQSAPPAQAAPPAYTAPQSPASAPPPAAPPAMAQTPAAPPPAAAPNPYSPPVPAAPPSRVGQPAGPPPLQPGQRVLEIPPTGLQSGSPFAYLSLTDVRGPNTFMLQLVSLADDSQLFRSDLRVDCPDPLLTVEVTVPLPPISPPTAGIYALELLHNNEILGSLRIIVEDAPQ
jgi:hypothetical protein